MTQLPASNYLSDNARTEGEMKQALEDQLAAIKQGIGHAPKEQIEIVSGSITPTAALVVVGTEGGVGTDFLDRMDVSNHPTGRVIFLHGDWTSGQIVTVRHAQGGNGQFFLAGATSLELNAGVTLIVYNQGNLWLELGRFYGNATADFREYLGIGSAALKDEGAGNGLDADQLDGLHASAFLQVGQQATDAATLDGIDSTGFVRIAETGEQAVAGPLATDGNRLRIRHALATGTAGVEFYTAGNLRAGLTFEDISDTLELRIYDQNETLVGNMRLSSVGEIERFDFGSGTWGPIWHKFNDGSGSGLDADLLKGGDIPVDGDTIPAAGIKLGQFTFAVQPGSAASPGSFEVQLPRFSFTPVADRISGGNGDVDSVEIIEGDDATATARIRVNVSLQNRTYQVRADHLQA